MPFSRSEPDNTLGALFAQRAAQQPTQIAIQDGQQRYTYAEVAHLSAQLAATIQTYAGARERPVVLVMPNGAAAVACLLGAARSGHPYVALDPDWPAARQAALLEWLQADCLIYGDTPPPHGLVRHCLSFTEACQGVGSLVAPPSTGTELAAIYFTSGSSGTPKGVCLSHRSLLHSAWNHIEQMGLGSGDRLLWLSPIAFGASNVSIFGSLLSGATLHCFDLKKQSIKSLGDYIRHQQITVLHSTASLFRDCVQGWATGERLDSLRLVKLGGESVYVQDIVRGRRILSADCIIVNGLGVTEAGGNVCFYPCPPPQREWLSQQGVLAVGPALSGFTLKIIDAAGQTLAPGHCGEIVIASSYLADGYFRQPHLTEERFRADGYHTGDLGVMDDNGYLIHLGRLDRMLKIRGYQVDPSEIEAALLAQVSANVAFACKKTVAGQERLVCYLEREPTAAPTEVELREILSQQLPDYLVPFRIISLAVLPRLDNGKLDRQALLKQPLSQRPTGFANTRPDDTLQMRLLSLWEYILAQAPIGIDQSFFDLGGDSLAAAKLFVAIEEQFAIDLPLSTLTTHPTVRALAKLLRQQSAAQPLSPAVLLSAGSEAAVPVFCATGAGADALALRDLALSLDPRFACYAFQYPGIDAGTQPFHSLSDLARDWVTEIRRLQPHGPYRLVGSSFGGWMVLEMAQQLRASGQEVGFLGFLDSHGLNYPRPLPGLHWRKRFELLLRWLRPLGWQEDRSWKNLQRGLKEHFVRYHARLRLWLFPQRSLPRRLRHIHLQEMCIQARKRYQWRPYAGDVYLFRAEQQPPAHLYCPLADLGWGSLIQGQLHIQEVPGYHGAHVRPPHVYVLGQRLSHAMLAGLPTDTAVSQPQTPLAEGGQLWEQLADWWNALSNDEQMLPSRTVLLPYLENQLATCQLGNVLEIGCGNGWLSRRLARLGATVTAVDIAEKLLAHARTLTADTELTIQYRQMDACQTRAWQTWAAESFDTVVCYMALMDMPCLEPLFAGLQRVLKPGGRFLFALALAPNDTPEAQQPFNHRLNADQPKSLVFFPYSKQQLLQLAATQQLVVIAWQDLLIKDERYAVGSMQKPA